jgi:hypothetical protein
MPDRATLSSQVWPAFGQFDSYVKNHNKYWEGVQGVQCVTMLLESQRNAVLPWEWKSLIITAIHHIYYGVIDRSSSTSCLLVSKSLIFSFSSRKLRKPREKPFLSGHSSSVSITIKTPSSRKHNCLMRLMFSPTESVAGTLCLPSGFLQPLVVIFLGVEVQL